MYQRTHASTNHTPAQDGSAYNNPAPSDNPAPYAAAAPLAAVKRVSWGAVFSGVVVVIAIQLLLGTLGIGIGASTVSPTTQENPVQGLGIGTAIWFGVSTLLALFAGALVAGRLAGMPLRIDGMLHGLVVWGLSTLLTFYLLTTAVGGIIGGTASIMGKGLSVAGQGAAAAGNAASGNPDTVGQAQDKLDQLKNIEKSGAGKTRSIGKSGPG